MEGAGQGSSQEHFQAVWERCAGHDLCRIKGPRVKLGRWASFLNANREWARKRTLYLLIILYMGLSKGWWANVSEVLIDAGDWELADIEKCAGNESDKVLPQVLALGSDGAAASGISSSSSTAAPHGSASSSSSVAPPGCTATGSTAGAGGASSRGAGSNDSACGRIQSRSSLVGGPSGSRPPIAVGTTLKPKGDEPRSVKDSNQAVQVKRGKAKHTLDFVARVLGNAYGNAVANIINPATGPFAEWFDTGRTITKTVRGNREWHIGLCTGDMTKVLCSGFEALETPSELEAMGFVPPSHAEFADPGAIRQDAHLADLLVRLVMAEAFNFLLSSMTFSDCLPGYFMVLLSGDSGLRKHGLLQLSGWFRLLCDMEELAEKQGTVKRVLRDLMWPQETFVREVLVLLAESDFQDISYEVRHMIQGYADSWKATVVNEDMTNKLRYVEGAQSAGRFARPTRWYRAQESGPIERYDRKLIKGTAASANLNTLPPPDKVYKHSGVSQLSLHHNMLNLFNDAAAYPHMSLAAMKLRGAAWLCIRYFRSCPENIELAWLSLLCSAGWLVHDGSDLGGGRGASRSASWFILVCRRIPPAPLVQMSA